MWGLFNQAKTWGCRPSSLLNVTDPYQAFCLDEAVAVFGNYVEHRLAKIEDKDHKRAEKKREAELQAILTGKEGKKYATPPPTNVSK